MMFIIGELPKGLSHSPFSPFCLLPFLLQEYFVEDLGELLLWVGHVR